jgi:ribose 5-phosphate isomerase B
MNPAPPPLIAIGGDHAGLPLKQALQGALAAQGHGLLDFGTNETASVDYPDFAHQVCAAVQDGRARFGVLVCGSGIGMAIAANRHRGIRAAVLHDATEARLTRAHNDANVAAFRRAAGRAGGGAGRPQGLPVHCLRGRSARPPLGQALAAGPLAGTMNR